MPCENPLVTLFYSYSHEDENLRAELEKHLSILRRQGVISEWHDRKIVPGEEWAGEIDTHLKSSQIVLLLVSSDFLASDYCYDKEMELALKRHESGEARVLPIVLRSVDWKAAPFGKLQALPKDAKPVVSWEDRDEAFTNVAQGIRAAVADITKVARRRATLDIENSSLGNSGRERDKKVRLSQCGIPPTEISSTQVSEPVQDATEEGPATRRPKTTGSHDPLVERPPRRYVVAMLCSLGVVALAIWGWLQFEHRREPERNYHRMSAYRNWVQQDSAMAALFLSEVSIQDQLPEWTQNAIDLLQMPIATRVFHLDLAVSAVDMSGDGRQLLLGFQNGLVRLGNTDGSGTPLGLADNRSTVKSVELAPDGKLALVQAVDGSVRLYRFDGPQASGATWLSEQGASCADLSPDGRQVAIGFLSGSVGLWDAAELGHRFMGHGGPVSVTLFSPDGSMILTGSADGVARVWNVRRPATMIASHQHGVDVMSGTFGPDGRVVATGDSEGVVFVWTVDGSTPPVSLKGPARPVRAVQFSPSDGRLLVAYDGGDSILWNLDDPSKRMAVLDRGIFRARFSPSSNNGSVIVLGSEDGTSIARSEDLDNLKALTGHQGAVSSVGFSEDGAWLVTGSVDGTARVWSLLDPGDFTILRAAAPVTSLAYSTSVGRLVVGTRDGTAELRDFKDSEQVAVLPLLGGAVLATAFRSDDASVVTWSSNGNALRIAATGNGLPEFLAQSEGALQAARLSSDGLSSLTLGVDGTVTLWDAEFRGEVVLKERSVDVRGVALGPKGQVFALGYTDGTVRVWDRNVSRQPVLDEHDDSVDVLEFSKNGTQLLSATSEGSIRIWRLDDLGESIVLLSPSPVIAAAFDDDNARILTGHRDGSTRIWDMGTGQEIARLSAHQDPVTVVCLSANGDHAFTGSSDGTVRSWLISTKRLRERLNRSTAVCIPAALRHSELGESPREAERIHQACESGRIQSSS